MKTPTASKNLPHSKSLKTTHQSARILVGSIAALLAVHSARGASATWSGANNAAWNTVANWSAAPVPGTGDTATFNGVGNGFTNLDLGGGVTIGSIIFDTASEF